MSHVINYDFLLVVDRINRKEVRKTMRESLFQNVCNGKIKANGDKEIEPKKIRYPICQFLHRSSPFLMLGPFHLDIKLYSPFRSVFRDFFTPKEMNWMIEYSKPRLSASRTVTQSKAASSKARDDQNLGLVSRSTVAKAIQTWFKDINYTEIQIFEKVSSDKQPLKYNHPPLKDPQSYSIIHPIMYKISQRIELSTGFNVTSRFGASEYQTTNYGLSGMVATHTDPWGYESGKNVDKSHHWLTISGDYIATFMGWFEKTEAGGGTAFVAMDNEGLIEPSAGDAAFWMNIYSSHYKDAGASHAGCPVLKGSKWILNKWIYSWDQWKKWPCDLDTKARIIPILPK